MRRGYNKNKTSCALVIGKFFDGMKWIFIVGSMLVLQLNTFERIKKSEKTRRDRIRSALFDVIDCRSMLLNLISSCTLFFLLLFIHSFFPFYYP